MLVAQGSHEGDGGLQYHVMRRLQTAGPHGGGGVQHRATGWDRAAASRGNEGGVQSGNDTVPSRGAARGRGWCTVPSDGVVSGRVVNPKWARWWSTAAMAAAVAASTIFCSEKESLVAGVARSARGVTMRGCGRREWGGWSTASCDGVGSGRGVARE